MATSKKTRTPEERVSDQASLVTLKKAKEEEANTSFDRIDTQAHLTRKRFG